MNERRWKSSSPWREISTLKFPCRLLVSSALSSLFGGKYVHVGGFAALKITFHFLLLIPPLWVVVGKAQKSHCHPLHDSSVYMSSGRDNGKSQIAENWSNVNILNKPFSVRSHQPIREARNFEVSIRVHRSVFSISRHQDKIKLKYFIPNFHNMVLVWTQLIHAPLAIQF